MEAVSRSWENIGLADLPKKILEEFNRNNALVVLETEKDVPTVI